MSKSYERAKELLAHLGTPVRRPQRPRLGPGMGVCERCNGVVTWAGTVTGSRMPLDVHPEGNLVIRDGVAIDGLPADGEKRFVPHFKSCRERGGKS